MRTLQILHQLQFELDLGVWVELRYLGRSLGFPHSLQQSQEKMSFVMKFYGVEEKARREIFDSMVQFLSYEGRCVLYQNHDEAELISWRKDLWAYKLEIYWLPLEAQPHGSKI